MRMPQAVIPVLPGFRVAGSFAPDGNKAFVITGFQIGGTDFAGLAIPSYDFLLNQGVRTRFYYGQAPDYTEVFDGFDTDWFYLTNDFLYQFVPFGPRVVTGRFEVTVENSLLVGVFLSLTAFEYEMPVDDVITSMRPARLRIVKPE